MLTSLAEDTLYNVFNEHLSQKQLHIEHVGRLCQTSRIMRDLLYRESTHTKCLHYYPHSIDDLPIEVLGILCWYREGQIHRDGDKPSKILNDGTKYWYKNGKVHRDGDQPAVWFANDSKSWLKNGKLHRDDNKPAIINPNGSMAWYNEGKLYRSLR